MIDGSRKGPAPKERDRVKTTTSGSTTTTYSYDGEGKRLQASTGTQAANKTNFLWDITNAVPQVALERDGNNSILRSYRYGTRRIAQTAGSSTSYYAYDAMGSTANLTSSTGATQWTWSYEPFGAIRTETKANGSQPTNMMKFAGEYLDPTSLYHLRARQYEPATGRFLARDPLPAVTTTSYVSTYAYAGDQPTVFIDPSGLRWCWKVCGAVDWAVHHPDVIVDAVAVGCVIFSAGTCLPYAYAAVATTVGTSVYNNGLLTDDPNWGRFGVDVAVSGITFGAGSLWGKVMGNPYFVLSASDRALLVRLGALELFGINFVINGYRGNLGQSGK